MRFARWLPLLIVAVPAFGQKPLPPLKDGTVIDEKATYRQDGPLHITGHVQLHGISLDLRGPVTIAAGSDVEFTDVSIRVSDPPESANGTSSLRCEGPAKITIRHSSMTEEGSAHPIWMLQGQVTVDGFETSNSEFHLDHVQAELTNFKIFELEISRASHVIGRGLRLVFLSTHTSDDERLEFSDIPTDTPFSRKLQMGSGAEADLTDTSAQLFLLYVHGRSDVKLSRIGRAQLSIAPSCHGTFSLPHGMTGTPVKPVVVPQAGASDCPFRFQLSEVNVDTWDVYAGDGADLTFTSSVIDELTASGNAKVTVRDSDVYADWLSFGGNAELLIERSTVGAQRLAAQRPDLATSEVRLGGHSRSVFEHVKFDCGIFANGDASVSVRDPITSPKYVRREERATVSGTPRKRDSLTPPA
jgi:hypothetical protein